MYVYEDVCIDRLALIVDFLVDFRLRYGVLAAEHHVREEGPLPAASFAEAAHRPGRGGRWHFCTKKLGSTGGFGE